MINKDDLLEEPQLDEDRYASLKGVSRPGKLDFEGKRRFIESLLNINNVAAACRSVGVSRPGAYYQKSHDPEFSQAWDDAIEEGIDNLLQEGKRRAHEGVTEAVYHQGVKIGNKKKYSDTLLMFLVKARRPEYRDNKQITVDGEMKTSGVLLLPVDEINAEVWEQQAIKQQEELLNSDDTE